MRIAFVGEGAIDPCIASVDQVDPGFAPGPLAARPTR